jgi:hypothetical protein
VDTSFFRKGLGFRKGFGFRKGSGNRHEDVAEEWGVPRALVVGDDGTLEWAARVAGYVTATVPGPVGAARLLRLRCADVLAVDARRSDPEQAIALMDYAWRVHPSMRVWVRTDSALLGDRLVLAGAERWLGAIESPAPLFVEAMRSFLAAAPAP